ncbi:hypothetical protein F4808DRAFT_421086 [Astrocystis sublimbata]|nr:hypothetical protein F4808DRAFT_421086 [Astrocystis sublimbata]
MDLFCVRKPHYRHTGNTLHRKRPIKCKEKAPLLRTSFIQIEARPRPHQHTTRNMNRGHGNGGIMGDALGRVAQYPLRPAPLPPVFGMEMQDPDECLNRHFDRPNARAQKNNLGAARNLAPAYDNNNNNNKNDYNDNAPAADQQCVCGCASHRPQDGNQGEAQNNRPPSPTNSNYLNQIETLLDSQILRKARQNRPNPPVKEVNVHPHSMRQWRFPVVEHRLEAPGCLAANPECTMACLPEGGTIADLERHLTRMPGHFAMVRVTSTKELVRLRSYLTLGELHGAALQLEVYPRLQPTDGTVTELWDPIGKR